MSSSDLPVVVNLRQKVPFADVVGVLTGASVMSNIICCPHPDHQDNSPSFKMTYDDTRGWRGKCFGGGCGWSGDIFDLVTLFRPSLQTPDRVITEFFQGEGEELIRGLDVGDLNEIQAFFFEERERSEFFARVKEHALLSRDAPWAREATDELTSRGVHPQTINDLSWGVYSYYHFLNDPRFTEEEFTKYGIKPRHGDSPNSPTVEHMFFYYRSYDLLSALKVRKVGGKAGEARTWKCGGPKDHLGVFGLKPNLGEPVSRLFGVEGEFDVMTIQSRYLVETGDTPNIICCSGTSFKNHKTMDLLENMAKGQLELVMWPDNDPPKSVGEDPPGVGLVTDISKIRKSRNITLRVVWPVDYEPATPGQKYDPADYITDTVKNPSVLEISKKLVASKMSVPHWLAQRAIAKYTASTDAEDIKQDTLRQNLVKVAADSDLWGFDLQDYIHYVVTEVGDIISEDSLQVEIHRTSRKPSKHLEVGSDYYCRTSSAYAKQMPGKKDEPPVFKDMCNFLVDVDKEVNFVGYPYDSDTPPFRICRVQHTRGSSEVILTNDDRNDGAIILRKIRDGFNGAWVHSAFKKDIDSVITAFNDYPPSAIGIDKVGMNRINGENVYITHRLYVQGGTVFSNEGSNPRFYVHDRVPTSKIYDIPLFKLPRDVNGKAVPTKELLQSRDMVLNQFVNIYHTQYIPLTVLGFTMAAPILTGFNPPMKACLLHLEGARASGKTHMAQFALNLCGTSEVRRQGGVNASWTPNRIEVEFNYQAGVLQLIDDLKADTLVKELPRFIGIFQNYHDRQGRGRLTKDSKPVPMPFIRGLAMSTGESLPTGDGGLISRMIILRCNASDYNETVVEQMLGHEHMLSRLWPHYIAWTQRQGALALVEYVKLHEKSRTDPFLNIMGNGLRYFFTFLEEEIGADPQVTGDLFEKWRAWAQGLAVENHQLVTVQRDDHQFMGILYQLLNSGQVTVMDNKSANCIGYVQGEYVYLFQDLTIAAVTHVNPSKRWDKGSISRLLATQGWLAKGQAGEVRGDQFVRGVFQTTTSWVIDRAKLFGAPGVEIIGPQGTDSVGFT